MASNFSKWSTDPNEEQWPLYGVLFIARNKDNKGIQDFKERRKAFLIHAPEFGELPKSLFERFDRWKKEGVPDEFDRLYISINSRNAGKIKMRLMHKLIDETYPETEIRLTHMNTILTAIAMNKDCANEKKWLIDFDLPDVKAAESFAAWLSQEEKMEVDLYKTPNAFALIAEHGFDVRKLTSAPDHEICKDKIDIKKDAMLCIAWGKMEEKTLDFSGSEKKNTYERNKENERMQG